MTVMSRRRRLSRTAFCIASHSCGYMTSERPDEEGAGRTSKGRGMPEVCPGANVLLSATTGRTRAGRWGRWHRPYLQDRMYGASETSIRTTCPSKRQPFEDGRDHTAPRGLFDRPLGLRVWTRDSVAPSVSKLYARLQIVGPQWMQQSVCCAEQPSQGRGMRSGSVGCLVMLDGPSAIVAVNQIPW